MLSLSARAWPRTHRIPQLARAATTASTTPLAYTLVISLRASGKKPLIAAAVAMTRLVPLLRVSTGKMDVASSGALRIHTVETMGKATYGVAGLRERRGR